jgi:hypothetical protein
MQNIILEELLKFMAASTNAHDFTAQCEYEFNE